jgi:hypothetical protein
MLPQGTEPLRLADGTLINPIDGGIVKDNVLVEVPRAVETQREITASRMRISDLPAPPKQMNTLSVILTYSLQGINDEDIGNVLGIEEDRIHNIKASDVYKDLQAAIIKNITESDLSDVRSLFVAASRKSARVMIDTAEDDELGILTRMSAANSILDRAGLRPNDVVEHRHSLEGELVIKYKDTTKDDVPIIDVTPEEF